jgi:hypothetical protein
MFAVAASDRAALDAYIPSTIESTLIIYAAISSAIMGYVLAASRGRYFAVSTTLFVLLALAITLIVDLDRPRTGSVTVSIEPFQRAAQTVRALEHAKPHKP